jgi:hypothetical protein
MSGTGDVIYSKSVQSVQSAVISSLSRFTYSYLLNSNLPATYTANALNQYSSITDPQSAIPNPHTLWTERSAVKTAS